jgi:tetratricopeptide (TPR) repeat protein
MLRDHPDVAIALDNLALLCQAQGRYADAEPLHKRSLAILEKAFGADHPNVAKALNNLAALYDDQGRYADAEPLYRRSLAVQEKVLAPDHPDVADSAEQPGGALSSPRSLSLYHYQGRYADAEPLLKRSLAIYERAFDPDSIATALNDLAALYKAQGRYADAEPLLKRSLAVGEKALGPGPSEFWGGAERPSAALPGPRSLWRRRAVVQAVVGAIALDNLALLYQAQGRYADDIRESFRSRSPTCCDSTEEPSCVGRRKRSEDPKRGPASLPLFATDGAHCIGDWLLIPPHADKGLSWRLHVIRL